MERKLKALSAFLLLLPSRVYGAGEGLLGQFSGGPIENPDDIRKLIETATNIVLLIGGIAFFAMILWGGVTIGTAAGNEERLSKGKKILTAAIVGIFIIIAARILVGYFVTFLGGTIE
jgi:hypothetical protein